MNPLVLKETFLPSMNVSDLVHSFMPTVKGRLEERCSPGKGPCLQPSPSPLFPKEGVPHQSVLIRRWACPLLAEVSLGKSILSPCCREGVQAKMSWEGKSLTTVSPPPLCIKLMPAPLFRLGWPCWGWPWFRWTH